MRVKGGQGEVRAMTKRKMNEGGWKQNRLTYCRCPNLVSESAQEMMSNLLTLLQCQIQCQTRPPCVPWVPSLIQLVGVIPNTVTWRTGGFFVCHLLGGGGIKAVGREGLL
jgi:hypothetical protein